MHLTTLNKIVSLFLIGSLVIIGTVTVLSLFVPLASLLKQLSELKTAAGEGSMAVLAGLLFLAFSAAGGALSESLTDLTIRRPIKAVARSARGAKWLCQRRSTGYYLLWRERFVRVVLESDAYRGLAADGREHGDGANRGSQAEPKNPEEGVAVGMLYWTRQAEAIGWAELHYSTFIMVSNLAFLSLLILLSLPLLSALGHCSWPAASWGMMASAVSLYAFSSMACDRMVYAYEVAFRQAVVTYLEGASPSRS